MKKYIIGFSIIIGLSACEKTNSIPDRFTINPEGNTNIKFLNLAPGSPQLNFFANGIKITASAATGTGAITGMAYPSIYPTVIGYTTLPAGSIKLDAKVTDSSAIAPGLVVLSATQTFQINKFYTFALIDTFTNASLVFVEDDPNVPDQTKAYMRLGNFIADGDITVQVTKTSADYAYTKTYSNVTSKTVLPFDSIGAGNGQIYKIVMFRASNNARLDSIVGFNPIQSKKYTFYARGLLRVASPSANRPLISVLTTF